MVKKLKGWLWTVKTNKEVLKYQNYRVYVLFPNKKTQCPQIYIKLTQFDDYDSFEILLTEVL